MAFSTSGNLWAMVSIKARNSFSRVFFCFENVLELMVSRLKQGRPYLAKDMFRLEVFESCMGVFKSVHFLYYLKMTFLQPKG